MIKSMTGFGRAEYTDELRTITVEIKSVNHRYADITVKMPRRYQFAEESVKALVKQVASRGKIEISINVDNIEADVADVRLNKQLAVQYYSSLKELKAAIPEISGEPDLRMIALMPEVLKTASKEEDEELFMTALTAAVSEAASKWDTMRLAEGEKLAADLKARGEFIENVRTEIEAYAPQVKLNYTQKMKDRIQELLGDDAVIPEDRILLEAAVFADKSDVTEELVRLKSHGVQLQNFLKGGKDPVGKKLDFLVQEMNRESNTIGSKANDINITNNVLVLKAEIEKIREQVQNIE